ncbi:MAG: pseudouridine synthase [Polyangiaceae bacterium]
MTTVRLQKILARGGIASRRAAERYITEGRVRVNGKVVTELGSKADPMADKVELDGRRVVAEQAVYLVMHKPRGVVSTLSDPEGRPTVRTLLQKVPVRVFPVGRLDFATSGVLLATNDGDFSDALLHPRKDVPKTYVVKVQGKMEVADIERWRRGIRLEDGMTKPADAALVRYEGDKTWFTLTIREGRNQQVRRMGEATGFRVMRLSRTQFANVSGEGLKPGEWRYLSRDEMIDLKRSYGVPKKIPGGHPEEVSGRAARPRAEPRGPRKDAGKGYGRDTAKSYAKDAAKTYGKDSSKSYGKDSGKGASKSYGNDSGKGSSKSYGQDSGKAPAGARSPRRSPPSHGSTEGPRYGGGAPGRRGIDTREDWGGGVVRGGRTEARGDDGSFDSAPPRRGSSGRGRPESSGGSSSGSAAKGDLGRGGRFGPTRTTGTGGGIHSREGDHERGPRVPGRSKRR